MVCLDEVCARKNILRKYSAVKQSFGGNGTINAKRGRSVPAGRLFEFHFDNLARFGDFNPFAIGFPAFGDDLNQNFSERRVGNVGDAFAIGFYVEFDLLVFAEFSLFDVLEIDAGIFDGSVGIATDDFDAKAIGLRGLSWRVRIRSWIILGLGGVHEEARQEQRQDERVKKS